MSLEVFLPLQFLELFQRISVNFSKCLIEFTCEATGSWTLVCWKFLILVSISVLMIHLFTFSVSSWFSLGKPYVRICHFIQAVHFTGIELFIAVSYVPFYFCGVSCVFPVFISNFIVLRPLIFIPDGLRFLNLVLSFQISSF